MGVRWVSDTMAILAAVVETADANSAFENNDLPVFLANRLASNFAGDVRRIMPRARRVFTPGISVHVIQRGNNRIQIFGPSNDYEKFLELLRRAARNCCV